ncbi:D-aminoacyl-tRNA deacylase [Halorhodospira halophila]|uniref:D-aminoacyl-tRNA deacylase n=1 Tax=Halorhodospira halophila (strain DSM 244 / SL1) TaxID=349124 RepID=DTD_HALHL|nr:D-aminoacyl-tRNA deacylase [Halorhodospira halophila]A1WW09.1 RecName: Full=D-aminoacyl-tRNA deacylase; Short=DTD; AltName: Full=Gly-tRNA(Ala) deacylase [Halorhodospira halophila SL1]ABM61871.1 D-tyrosyl-tRNA(Tyr) deacylase [Halorhodospira halophila SL1]MBK1729857.1 D-tyrosyl-tRNA(Tyr) deacylase [Halorhodospira halophila]
MITVIQRTGSARVRVGGEVVGEIERGLVALVCAVHGDGSAQAQRLAERVLGYRVFPDAEGRMNGSALDLGCGVLAVPQFTLAADTRKGMRPSFGPAADPQTGQALFETFLEALRERATGPVASGVFGADMQVELVNDGPVTFWLEAPPRPAGPV